MLSGANHLYAQEKTLYQTRQLEEIGRLLETHGISPMGLGEYDVPAICAGVRVCIETGFGGLISQIRFVLFDSGLKQEYAHPVYDFVERYLLYLLLMKDPAVVSRRLSDDKVDLRLNGVPFEKSQFTLGSFVAAIRPDTDFLFKSDSVGYRLAWNTSVGTLQLSFPKQYELLVGKDKIEMEDDFQKELFLFVPEKVEEEQLVLSVLTPLSAEGYYKRVGKHYIIRTLNTDRYYRVEAGGKPALFLDTEYPEESLANLFLEGDRMGHEVMMSVEHRRYGKRRDHVDVSVNQLVAFCKKERCVPYFGIEESDEKKISGTVIMVNEDLGYNHVLYYECVREKMKGKDAVIKAWLYTYVPTHNVWDLFEEYRPKAKKLNY